ncbi:MAG TPA: MotA/TolQ/ExbB proton channel family protein [Gammaproteobacteria bacterium]|nr:MotA/TolQ/ExbB proton channel family protein [Gammaproteobacteria bacterium]
METLSAVVAFFQKGGPFMYPIVAVLAMGLAIAIERWIYLTVTVAKNKAVWNKVAPYLKSGNIAGAMQVTSKSKAAIAQIMTYGLNRVRSARRREDVEQAMEESLMEVVPRLEKRTHYLATFANISTLLGLLGTITGLISAFAAVSNANPAEKADLLSAAISVAMNTTAFGLIVAIPMLLIHTMLTTKTTEIVDSLEMASVKFLNSIMDRAQAEPPAHPHPQQHQPGARSAAAR